MTNEEKSELQRKVVETINPTQSGRLLLAPRAGKTKLAIDIVNRDRPSTVLWVTPFSKLAKEDIPNEIKEWGEDPNVNYKIITWRALGKETGDYDIIFLDEEQYITKNNSQTLIRNLLRGRVITMTGTETKDFSKLNLIKRLGLEVLYRIDINEAVDIGLLSNYDIKVVGVDMSEVKDISRLKGKFFVSEKENYAYLDKKAEEAISKGDRSASFMVRARTNAIKNSNTKNRVTRFLLHRLKGRKLLFAPSIKMSGLLCDYTYNSKTDDTDYIRFAKGEIDSLAMVDSGGVGHTYKGIDHLILMQASRDTNGDTSQKIARTLLSQKDYKACIWLICLKGTRDFDWVKSSLSRFDSSKVEFIEFTDLKI